jgi:hypothetical protein
MQKLMDDAWTPRVKYRPSLFGYIRRTHVPFHLIQIQRSCMRAIRTSSADVPTLTYIRDTIDMIIREIVMKAFYDLEYVYAEMIRHPLWRRLILWSRARIAARRVLLRRMASGR